MLDDEIEPARDDIVAENLGNFNHDELLELKKPRLRGAGRFTRPP